MKPRTKNVILNLIILGSAIIALTSGWKLD